MARYEVKFYRGDYPARQRAANRDRAVCYVEHHFNSVEDPDPNYSMAVVATNASDRSCRWGRMYAEAVARRFGIPNNGVRIGGRGDGNLCHTQMPAILVEPFFVSNGDGAAWAGMRQEEVARILAETIGSFFPAGGLVAFSVGHKYKASQPADRGAPVVGGGTEADLAEQVLLKAAELLQAEAEPDPEPDAVEPSIPVAAASEWAEEAQQWVVAQGISDGTRPQAEVTREEVWTMLHRALRDRG